MQKTEAKPYHGTSEYRLQGWEKLQYANKCLFVGSERRTTEPLVLLDFSLTVKAAPHECAIRTNQP